MRSFHFNIIPVLAVAAAMINLNIQTTNATTNNDENDIGCCSLDFKTCASWYPSWFEANKNQPNSALTNMENCDYDIPMVWLDEGALTGENEQCIERWNPCPSKDVNITEIAIDDREKVTNVTGTCCPGMICHELGIGYSQCMHPEDLGIAPSESPTANPTNEPTANPTANPTNEPTASPTANPTNEPTASPSAVPTPSPSAVPTVIAQTTTDGNDDSSVLDMNNDACIPIKICPINEQGQCDFDTTLQFQWTRPTLRLKIVSNELPDECFVDNNNSDVSLSSSSSSSAGSVIITNLKEMYLRSRRTKKVNTNSITATAADDEEEEWEEEISNNRPLNNNVHLDCTANGQRCIIRTRVGHNFFFPQNNAINNNIGDSSSPLLRGSVVPAKNGKNGGVSSNNNNNNEERIVLHVTGEIELKIRSELTTFQYDVFVDMERLN